MDWVCLCSHEGSEPRRIWEDVRVLPAEDARPDQAWWLTVEALGELDGSAPYARAADHAAALAMLAGRDFAVTADRILVRAAGLDRDSLLHWVGTWLREFRFPVDSVIEVDRARFRGPAPHADLRQALEPALPNQR